MITRNVLDTGATSLRSRLLPLLALGVLLPACSDRDPAAPLQSTAAPRVLFAVGDPTWLHQQVDQNVHGSIGPAAAADDFIVPEGVSWNITRVLLMSTDKPCDLRFFTYEAGVQTEVNTYVNVTAGASSQVYDPGGADIYQHTISLPAALTLGPGRYWLGARGSCGPDQWFGFHWAQANGGHLLDGITLNNDWSVNSDSWYPAGFMFALYGTVGDALLAPTFTFDLAGALPKSFGAEPFDVAPYATANSGGAITFGLGAGSAGCSVTPAGMVTITGAATGSDFCVIDAALAATATYSGATRSQSFNIGKANGTVSIQNLPSSANVGTTFTPVYDTPSDGATSVASVTPYVCTVAGGTVSFNAGGICTLVASVAEGTNYLAASGNEQSITVTAEVADFGSTCTYTLNPKSTQYHVFITWHDANPGVTLIRVTDGKVVEKASAPAAEGSWSLNVRSAPTYQLLGGIGRKDTGTVLKEQTACTPAT